MTEVTPTQSDKPKMVWVDGGYCMPGYYKPVEEVTPTQADREAAARMYRGDEIGAACCRDGSIDDTPLLQMVASHRIAHEAPLQAEVDTLRARVADLETDIQQMEWDAAGEYI